DEISNLVDLHMGMFDDGWKWQDLQGLLWLKIHCSPVPPMLLKKGTSSQKQGHRPTGDVYISTSLLQGKFVHDYLFVLSSSNREEGIDYDEVFAPVARIEAIRLFLAYASFKDFVVYQMDVKSAFLYGKIEEEVYVCQPSGFEDPEFPDRVYKIDKTLFIKRVKGDILLAQVYIDDIIFGSTRNEMCTEFENMMHKKFQMSSMGDLTFFLGLQVTQKDDGIFISQDKYVDEILKKFVFSTIKTASTPIETSKALLKDAEAEDVDVHLYRSMIGSLMYLTASRPDIMFVVCACARFQVTPKLSHLYAMKRIFRYLKGQPKLGLWYPKDSPFDFEAYTDSDYAGASLDRKSTTGGYQFLGSRLILWQCKKQTIVANSTTEAEYVATASCSEYAQMMLETAADDAIQFWQTTTASTLDNGEMEITATIDGKVKTVSEASIGKHLKLEDSDGISNFPTTEIFKQLALMRLSNDKIRDKNQVCLLCEVILKQISAFNFSCASLESIIAIENTWEWEKVWEDIPTLYMGFVWAGKMEFGEVGSFGPSLLITNFAQFLQFRPLSFSFAIQLEVWQF
ncbi:putative ribonuclease H-like domain-containing protein, partial [Tanacetum coccineum]